MGSTVPHLIGSGGLLMQVRIPDKSKGGKAEQALTMKASEWDQKANIPSVKDSEHDKMCVSA